MSNFGTKRLPIQHDAIALDGSRVRILESLKGGSLAHFEFVPGETSIAVAHRTVEEIWYFIGGQGEIWRKLASHEEVTAVDSGVCITIPLETHFQVRAFGTDPLVAIGVTIPPWPGDDEAYEVEGKWTPTLKR